MTSRLSMAAAVTALLFPLAACGGDTADGDRTDDRAETAAETVTLRGEFAPVPDAPAGAEDIGGNAEQLRTADGATVTITLFGLAPRTDYIAHLHAEPCGQPDPGGPHYRFDPAGDDVPPNEVHLDFVSDGTGSGAASTEVSTPLPDGEALSIVVHEAGDSTAGHEATPKLACADVG